MSESDYNYTKNEIERKELEDAAAAQRIDAVINSLPPVFTSWLDQLPPYDRQQAIHDLTNLLSSLYDEAFDDGLAASDALWSDYREFMPKEGEVND